MKAGTRASFSLAGDGETRRWREPAWAVEGTLLGSLADPEPHSAPFLVLLRPFQSRVLRSWPFWGPGRGVNAQETHGGVGTCFLPCEAPWGHRGVPGLGRGSVQEDPPEGARTFLHLSLFAELSRTGANLVYWIRFLSPRRETK